MRLNFYYYDQGAIRRLAIAIDKRFAIFIVRILLFIASKNFG